MQEPTGGRVELRVVLRFVDAATDALSAAREEIDALNVYPVPDGDTGTNMFLTVSAARDAIREVTDADPDCDLATALAVFSRGALLGARGNSGVILSQMLGAFATRLGAADVGDWTAAVLAEAMREATDASLRRRGRARRRHHPHRRPGGLRRHAGVRRQPRRPGP